MRRILIIDDHRLFGEALAHVLEASDVNVLEVVCNPAEAVEAVEAHEPEVVLIDLGMPGVSGLDVGRQILERYPEMALLAVTAMREPGTVRLALEIGFSGYLTKDLPVSRFVEAIRAAGDGNVVIPREYSRPARPSNGGDGDHDGLLADQLTRREREILALLAAGASGAEISTHLHISRNTVRTHIQNVLCKLQVHTRLEAAAFAVRNGLVEQTPQLELTLVGRGRT
jgi:DNA-binding NarL/FixJ family response regulator